MTVFSTWSQDVNAVSMMDGWCQRMNYYVAPARTDTTMFDHFTYFEGAEVEATEYHMESALLLVQSNDRNAATHVSRIRSPAPACAPRLRN